MTNLVVKRVKFSLVFRQPIASISSVELKKKEGNLMIFAKVTLMTVKYGNQKGKKRGKGPIPKMPSVIGIGIVLGCQGPRGPQGHTQWYLECASCRARV